MHYWGYRVDSTNRRFFYDEILQKRLRQGWGYTENQNLKHEGGPDISARRNLPILNLSSQLFFSLQPSFIATQSTLKSL